MLTPKKYIKPYEHHIKHPYKTMFFNTNIKIQAFARLKQLPHWFRLGPPGSKLPLALNHAGERILGI